jgi:hypothetical protein
LDQTQHAHRQRGTRQGKQLHGRRDNRYLASDRGHRQAGEEQPKLPRTSQRRDICKKEVSDRSLQSGHGSGQCTVCRAEKIRPGATNSKSFCVSPHQISALREPDGQGSGICPTASKVDRMVAGVADSFEGAISIAESTDRSRVTSSPGQGTPMITA